MNTWLFDNRYNPYPNESTKLELQKATDLSANQVSNYFINARRRHLLQWLHLEGKTDEEIKEILKRRGGSHDIKKKDYDRIKRAPKPKAGLDLEGVISFFRTQMKSCDVDKVPEDKDQILYQIYFDKVYSEDPGNCAIVASSNPRITDPASVNNPCDRTDSLDCILRPRANSFSKMWLQVPRRPYNSGNKENVGYFNVPETEKVSPELSDHSFGQLDSDYYTSSSASPSPPHPGSSQSHADSGFCDNFSRLNVLAHLACNMDKLVAMQPHMWITLYIQILKLLCGFLLIQCDIVTLLLCIFVSFNIVDFSNYNFF